MTSHPLYLRQGRLSEPSFFCAPKRFVSLGSQVSAFRSQVQVFSTRFGYGIMPAPAPAPEDLNMNPQPIIRSPVSL
jgi:hypothetical protein